MMRLMRAAALPLVVLATHLAPVDAQEIAEGESGLVAAEPVKKEPLAKSGDEGKPKKPLSSLDQLSPEEKKNELLFMEYEMAMNSIKLSPSVENKAKLLRVLENLINVVCMSDLLTTLSYNGDSDDPRCKRFISQALALDSDNPAAICARDGMDTKPCLDAYANQNLDRFNPESAPPETGIDRDVVEVSRKWDDKNIEILSKQLDDLLATFKAAKTDQLYIRTARQFRKVLAIACKYNEVAYTQSYDVPEVGEGQGGAGLILDPERRLSFVLKGRATPTPDPLDNKNLMEDAKNKKEDEHVSFKRTRYVASSCIDAIEKYRSEDFADWSMVCHPHGYYTPRCLRALRQAKQRNTSGRPRSSSDSERVPSGTGLGFSEF